MDSGRVSLYYLFTNSNYLNSIFTFVSEQQKMNTNKPSISNFGARRKLGSLGSKTSAAGGKNTATANLVTLTQHTTKIEEKLAKLRSEIDDKKRTSTREQIRNNKVDKPDPNLVNTFISTNKNSKMRVTKVEKKEEVEMDQALKAFLDKIGMEGYIGKMSENGIDSLEILKQCKQKQLEEMGISKGHALKIAINIKKSTGQGTKTGNRNFNNRESTHQSERSQFRKKQTNQAIAQKNNKEAPLEIIIQTDDISENQPLARKKRYFCLYCYQLCTEKEFCGEDCAELYAKMFKKYEDNLRKAQNLFVPQKNSDRKEEKQKQSEQEEEEDQQQQNENQEEKLEDMIDYIHLGKLDDNEDDDEEDQDDEDTENFNHQIYQQMLDIANEARRQAKPVSYQSLGLQMLSFEEQSDLNSIKYQQ